MAFAARQSLCEVDADAFVAEAHRRQQIVQMRPLGCLEAGFLAQFALCRGKPVLAAEVELSRGDLHQHAADRRSKLPDEIDVAVAVHRQHRRRADMPRDLPLGQLAVGQPVGQVVDV